MYVCVYIYIEREREFPRSDHVGMVYRDDKANF